MIEDIDECEEPDSCEHNFAECQNNIGSYKCNCIDGFLGNGFKCTVRDFLSIS